LVIIIAFVGSLIFNWSWIIIIPISLIIVAAFQAMSEQFWKPKKYCSRCNAPVSLYSKFCRNCGLKLFNKCPQCGKEIKSETIKCDGCGFKFQQTEGKHEPIKYQVIEKGSKLPERANFCINCGSNLIRLEKNNETCPFCGENIE
ncbi:MAG: zinc-ribbon domain-containing protein, partial [Promethearchaeota archaeon]